MVEFLNDDLTFKGTATHEGELIAQGELTIGPGGLNVGDSVSAAFWPAQARAQVANVTERSALVAWRNANAPIVPTNPLLVWRADGSLTGVNEITVDGTNWYAETPLAGDIEMTMADVAPYGWVLCQGQLLANAAVDYPALWANASTAFRVGGSLRLPDLRGRTPIGAGQGAGLTLRNIGDAAGTETVILSEAQLASHTHDGVTDNPDRSLNHRHALQRGGFEPGNTIDGSGRQFPYDGNSTYESGSITATTAPTAGPSLIHQHEFTTDESGSNQPHPNVQPSAVVNFKVKV